MKNSYTLYMAIDGIETFSELFTDQAANLIDSGSATCLPKHDYALDAMLYIFPGQMKPPKWLRHVSGLFPGCPQLTGASHAALIAFRTQEATYALTFGHAWMYLKEESFDNDFGLRATINLIDQDKLKTLERSNLGIAVRDFSQAAWQRRLQDFGLDEALEIVRKVSGEAAPNQVAERATGARSFKFVTESDLSEIPELADGARTLSYSDAYKTTEFRIIDFLRPVGDKKTKDILDTHLVTSIIDNDGNFELAAPQILSDDYSYFKIVGLRSRAEFPIINLSIYRSILGNLVPALDLTQLQSHKISVYSDDGSSPINKWPIYRCLVGSIELNQNEYALNEGTWYKVDQSFNESANHRYETRKCALDQNLSVLMKIGTPNNINKIHSESEESYNLRVGNDTDYICLDQKFVQIDGVTRGRGVEMCDLLDLNGRRFIHVKKGSGNSSALSHLFRQGVLSAQLLRSQPEARTKLRRLILDISGEADAELFDNIVANGERWTVEFRIADSRRANGEFSIPFFSKVSFKDASQTIETMQMNTAVGFIPLAP